MDMSMSIVEQRTQRRSKRFSIGFHLLLLLILFFFFRWEIDPGKNIDTQYAVAVNFDFGNSSASFESRAEEGASAPEEEENKVPEADPVPVAEEVQKEKVADEPIDEVIPDPIDPVVTEVLEEESDVVVVEDKPVIKIVEPKIIEKPKKQETPKPKENTNTSKPKTTTGKTKSEDEKASSTKPSSRPGTGKSTTGAGQGSDSSGNDDDSGIGDGGAGTGDFDDSGDGIFGRKVIYRPLDKLAGIMTKTGRIAIKTCVDRRGRATYVELIQNETTIFDRDLLKKALNVARYYRFEEDYSAPREQCGKITFILDINKFKADF